MEFLSQNVLELNARHDTIDATNAETRLHSEASTPILLNETIASTNENVYQGPAAPPEPDDDVSTLQLDEEDHDDLSFDEEEEEQVSELLNLSQADVAACECVQGQSVVFLCPDHATQQRRLPTTPTSATSTRSQMDKEGLSRDQKHRLYMYQLLANGAAEILDARDSMDFEAGEVVEISNEILDELVKLKSPGPLNAIINCHGHTLSSPATKVDRLHLHAQELVSWVERIRSETLIPMLKSKRADDNSINIEQSAKELTNVPINGRLFLPAHYSDLEKRAYIVNGLAELKERVGKVRDCVKRSKETEKKNYILDTQRQLTQVIDRTMNETNDVLKQMTAAGAYEPRKRQNAAEILNAFNKQSIELEALKQRVTDLSVQGPSSGVTHAASKGASITHLLNQLKDEMKASCMAHANVVFADTVDHIVRRSEGTLSRLRQVHNDKVPSS